MEPSKRTLVLRSSLLADLRIILLGSWAFILQTFRTWRLTPKLRDQNDDEHQP
jgi:hypothetical protein